MGFDWKLVQFVINELNIGPNHLVLDPFCGAGTTLVQCKKQGIKSVGIDANPVCILASKVKTFWNLEPNALIGLSKKILQTSEQIEKKEIVSNDIALQYLRESGMIDRGWLSDHKARKVVAIRLAIEQIAMKPPQRKFFRLALISAIVDKIADIKFGPEVYCLPQPKRTQVQASFQETVNTMIGDLARAAPHLRQTASSKIFEGDSRQEALLTKAVPNGADFVITSPPYPAEHDYTRSTRLELVMLGHVKSNDDIRALKKKMVRCHTKGIYKGDTEARTGNRYSSVREISKELNRRARGRTDGFSRLYGQMVSEYFGGMITHLRATSRALKPGGYCAYVIRDQKSLLGLYIDTPSIIAKLASSPAQGLKFVDSIEWKTAKGSTGNRLLSERILILRKPK